MRFKHRSTIIINYEYEEIIIYILITSIMLHKTNNYNQVIESKEIEIKEIDQILKKIHTSKLVAQYKKATWKNELIVFEKKKEKRWRDWRWHETTMKITAVFDENDNIDLELYSFNTNYEIGTSWRHNSNDTTMAYWNNDSSKRAINWIYWDVHHWKGKKLITDYNKYILQLEKKLESKTKRAKIITWIKKWIMNILSSKN